MSKPVALTDEQIQEIEVRLNKGWQLGRHHIEPLIAMARERNLLATTKATEQPSSVNMTVTL